MKVSTAALLACLAGLCIPTALALATPGAPAVPVQLPAVPDMPDVQAPQVDLPAGLSGSVGVDGVQVGAHAGPVAVGASDAAAPSLQPSTSGSTLVGKAAVVAQHAAGASLLTLLMVGYGSGLDGLRALFARPAARLQQAGRFALRLLPFMPLFSRIQGAQVLGNPVRARVHEAIVNDPGLSVEEVRARAGIAWGTAVHHLRRLEDTGLLTSVTQNARRRYFAANTPASSRRVQVAALAHPTARRVADLVRQRPGVDQTGLCEALGMRNPAASKHLSQLAAQGLVMPQRLGRHCHYHPTQALHQAFGILETPVAPPAAFSAPQVPTPA